MKKVIVLLGVLYMVFAVVGCSKDDFEYHDDYQKSYQAWLAFKEQSNNSYQYKVLGTSWTGYSWFTIITIVNGKVVQRDYECKYYEGGKLVSSEEWTELEAELNTHTSGAETITLDEVYNRAENDWLSKKSDVEYYFEAKNNGMISQCGYVENNCADDCFRGISIEWIEGLYMNQ